MRKNRAERIIVFSAAILLAALFSNGEPSYRKVLGKSAAIPAAFAERDDNEFEHENESGGDDNATPSTPSQTTKSTKSAPVYKTVEVTKVITTLDPQFTTDQDHDGIVDGLDPHPTVDEHAYFTDDDNDGIANAFDLHPGDDDFSYYEQDNDTNGNGILDSYESLSNK